MSGGGVRSVPARPDGDSMAKLFMMRWVLGIAAVSAAVLVVAIAWQSASSGVGRVSSATSAADQSDFARRRDELRFLQAAFDRLDAASSVPGLALSRDPALNLVILLAKPRAPRPTNEAAPDHSAEAPANPEARAAAKARAAQRAERAAERAAARPPAAGTAGFIE